MHSGRDLYYFNGVKSFISLCILFLIWWSICSALFGQWTISQNLRIDHVVRASTKFQCFTARNLFSMHVRFFENVGVCMLCLVSSFVATKVYIIEPTWPPPKSCTTKCSTKGNISKSPICWFQFNNGTSDKTIDSKILFIVV